ncbi:MAG: hypothetical protein EA421_13370 [Gemmatimonadales bacterium]|nr:MAG: hypothetical protein EA421_13370 [Gemmatimonadales bacterium]
MLRRSVLPRRPTDRVAMLPWTFVVLHLLVFAPGLGAQAVTQGAEAEAPVPQSFDWHQDRAIPPITPWGQPVDVEATRLILSWTTGEEFTNPLVDHLPLQEGVISPMEHFGYPMGMPGVLHTSSEFYAWYEALSASSPRVEMEYLNETEEGRRFALVKVGSEENLARLEEIREAYHRLTDPRITAESEMEELIRDLPAIYTVFSGLHSPETGHPEVTAELAWRVAVSDHPMIREIRDNAILFIVPVTDPDGRDRVVEWYRLHETETYRMEDRKPGPPFWGQYIRHDNNRDGFQKSLALSRQVVELFEHWKYPVGLDLHESVPFLYVSTGTGPYNPNIDAITRHEWQWIAHHEVTQLTAQGMPGVWTHDFFDGWNPGYMVFALNNRNANGRFYETFGNSVPTTMERTVGGNRTSVEWFRANPPYAEVTWSIRNNINYAQSGVLHSVHLVARNRDEVLRNYWRKNRNAVERGRTQPPHAWVVPTEQLRKADATHMLNLLRSHGVEIHRAEAEMTFGEGDEGISLRPGDFIIRADQPYGPYVRNLMEVQHFPEDAPRPYDDVAWTFPLLYNIEVLEVENREILEGAMTPVIDPVSIPGRVRDLSGRTAAAWWAVRYEASAHGLQARWELGADRPVYALREALERDEVDFGAGSWLLPLADFPEDEVSAWAERWGLEVAAVSEEAVEGLQRRRQTLPRIALLHTWQNTQDDGAIRFAFDTMEIPYAYLPEDRLREGDLRSRFDVILFPEQGRNAGARQIFEGLDPKDGPLPWEPHPDFPSLGMHSSTPDMTGGMGYEGLAALRDFVQTGGTLIALGSASTVPVEFGMVRGVSIRDPGGLFSPGSIVRGEAVQAQHPILWGYAAEFPVFDRFGPYLSVAQDQRENVILRYAPADRVFMSGLVLERQGLGGHPAVVSVPMGQGNIVLFGIRTLHRNQTRGSFALAWNAVLNWDGLEMAPTPATAAADAASGEEP